MRKNDKNRVEKEDKSGDYIENAYPLSGYQLPHSNRFTCKLVSTNITSHTINSNYQIKTNVISKKHFP